MGTTAVTVEGVSKRFRLYHEKYSSLKEKVIHAGRTPYTDLWALHDVGFEVQEGETVGILGHNGSGKSTLLKCVCGVLQPTSGQITVRGKLAGLLELGAGFQQELSGRDNIYLNGSMLGLSKREVDKLFDDIVEFAELEAFIDNQVKFYSSGMYVKLGFAVAVNVDPDVLVIDEVLAVGDERFQRKCIERIKRFQREGRTILFVSHSPDQVRSICDRAVVLSKGEMLTVGAPGDAVRIFRENLLEAGDVPPAVEPETDPAAAEVPPGTEVEAVGAGSSGPIRIDAERRDDTRPIRLTDVDAFFPHQGEEPYLRSGAALTIRVAFEAVRSVARMTVQLEVMLSDGSLLFRTDTEALGIALDAGAGPGAVDFCFPSVPLGDGVYLANIGIGTEAGLSDWREPACQFEVMNPGRSTGIMILPVSAAAVEPASLAFAPVTP